MSDDIVTYVLLPSRQHLYVTIIRTHTVEMCVQNELTHEIVENTRYSCSIIAEDKKDKFGRTISNEAMKVAHFKLMCDRFSHSLYRLTLEQEYKNKLKDLGKVSGRKNKQRGGNI